MEYNSQLGRIFMTKDPSNWLVEVADDSFKEEFRDIFDHAES